MAEKERIIIEVTETGARVVSRNIKGIGTQAKQTDKLVSMLRKGLLLLGGFNVIRGIIGISDAFTNMQNRLRLVTKDTYHLIAVTDRLLKTANETRTSLESTAQFYSRLALSAKALGIEEEKLFTVTRGVNQAIILSGATAREARDGLVQFSQAIASNRLGGDKLRSVLEQLPMVADVISEHLGVTRGEMRQMGYQGLLTADIIIEAFDAASASLEDQFAKTVPTVSQGWEVLKDNVLATGGEMIESSGIMEALANTLIYLGENMETVLKVAKVLAYTIGVALAMKAIPMAIRAVKTLSLALVKSGWGAVIVALGLVIGLIVEFGDKIKVSSDGLATWKDVLTSIWDILKIGVSMAFDSIVQFFDLINIEGPSSFSGLGKTVLYVLDRIVGLFAGMGKAVGAIFGNLSGTWELTWKTIVKALLNGFSKMANLIIDLINKMIRSVNRLMDAIPGISASLTELERADLGNMKFLKLSDKAKKAGADVADAFKEGWDGQIVTKAVGGIMELAEAKGLERKLTQENEERLKKQAEERRKAAEGGGGTVLSPGADKIMKDVFKATEDYKNALASLKELMNQPDGPLLSQEQYNKVLQETNLAFLETQTTGMAGYERALIKMTQTSSDMASSVEKMYTDIQEPMETYKNDMAALDFLVRESKITQDQYNASVRDTKIAFLETQNTMEAGMDRAILKLQKSWEDLGTQMESVTTSAFNGMADSLTEFVMTGKADFAALAKSIIADIAKMIIKQILLNTVMSAMGGGGGVIGAASGAASSGSGSGNARAEGGPVTAGVPYMVGERGRAEMFVPNQSGQIVSDKQLAAAEAPAPQITIVNSPQKGEMANFLNSDNGKKIILNTVGSNRTDVNKSLGR